MTMGHFFHRGHQQLIMIDGQIRLFENGSTFELIGSHLVMTGLDRDSQAMTFVFQFLHECRHPRRDGTEILILQLLIFRGRMPHQRTTAQFQVGTGIVQSLIHQEIFLLPSQRGYHSLHVFIEILANIHGSPVDHCQRLQHRRLEVKCFSRISHEYRGNTQRAVINKSRGSRVPSRVAASLEGVANSPVRETGRIGFLLNQ